MDVKLDLASVTQSITIDITLVFKIDFSLYSMQSIVQICSTTIAKLCVTGPSCHAKISGVRHAG